MTSTLKTRILLSSCLTLAAVPAFAQTAAPAADQAPIGGDIVVTATRRAQALDKVPISVEAFSQKTLDVQGIHDIADLAISTPGVTLTEGWGRSTNIAIRGIYSGTGARTTGIYIDDMPIQARALGASSTFTNAYPALFDLERVEVLKGPQGTLFGAGSEGGTVRFITPAPSLTTFSGYSRAELGFTEGGAPSYEVGSAIGGPIIKDKLGFRFSAYFRDDGGWVDRDPQPSGTKVQNSNKTTTESFHASLLWQVNENFKITPSAYWQRQHEDDASFYWANLSNPSAGNYASGQQIAQPETDTYGMYSVKGEYDFGFATLISNTSFLNRRDASTQDYTNFVPELLGLNYMAAADLGQQYPVYDDNRQHSFTQEVRLQSNSTPASWLNWTVGVFYQNSRQSADEQVSDPTLDTLTEAYFDTNTVGVLGSNLVNGGESYHGFATSRDRQVAGFGQVDIKPIPKLTLTAGVRVAHTMFNSTEVADGPLNGGYSTSVASAAQTPVTPKFAVAYQATPDWMVYGSASKGFREGGGNNKVAATELCSAGLAALGLSAAPTSYKSDSLWSYEAGVKGSALNRRVQLSADAFLINWDGIQNGVSLDCGQGFTANLGKARSEGLEGQLTVKPTAGLTLGVVGSYTDAKYTQSVTSNGTKYIILNGEKLFVPPWSVQLTGEYEAPIGQSAYSGYFHADYDYQSGYVFGLPQVSGYDANNDKAYAQHLMNLRAGVRRGQMDASVYVKNLFNSTDLLNIHHDLTSSALYRDLTYRPRTIGLALSYRY